MSDTTFDDFLLRAEKDREFAERQAQSRPSRDVALLLVGIRSRMNLSQAAFARQAGVTPSYISQLESGNANPGIRSLSNLLRRVGVSLRFEAVIAASPGLAGERVEAPVREETRHSTLSEGEGYHIEVVARGLSKALVTARVDQELLSEERVVGEIVATYRQPLEPPPSKSGVPSLRRSRG